MFKIQAEAKRQKTKASVKVAHELPQHSSDPSSLWQVSKSLLVFTFCISVVFTPSRLAVAKQQWGLFAADEALLLGLNKDANAGEGIWDPVKYIELDEIEPGMQAYCLTEYGLAGIEKFGMEVVDVVRNINPSPTPGSRDAILVRGTDERLMHTGPVAGCSGSPVYVDDRLAGALSFMWPYSKDPLYGVTPIKEMLMVGQGLPEATKNAEPEVGYAFDFSRPIDFAEIDRQLTTPQTSRKTSLTGTAVLPSPLITSGLPAEVCEQLNSVVQPLGLMVVPGIVGGPQKAGQGRMSGANSTESDRKLVPGACLVVPLVSGDITMNTYGTVTEVVGDKVYGFGHWLLGYGQIDLPMATGKVHTVVSNMLNSFKLASVVETVGALRTDESAGVLGRIGTKAKMIPLTIRIDRYNDTEKRIYNCQLADNRLITPVYLRAAVAGAALMLGAFPPDHMIEYKVAIDIDDSESIKFENVSSGQGVNEMIIESISTVALLMNNPYKEVDIKSIDYDIRIVPKNIISHIWSVNLSDSNVKVGEKIEIGVVVESVYSGKKRYQFDMEIPEDLSPGKYDLIVCGSKDYQQFLAKTVPYRFIAQSVPDLIDALNEALQISRDKLYCLLVLPAGGVTVEKAELPDLPATKALVMQDATRALKIQPYPHWLERILDIGTVVIDKKALKITVETR